MLACTGTVLLPGWLALALALTCRGGLALAMGSAHDTVGCFDLPDFFGLGVLLGGLTASALAGRFCFELADAAAAATITLVRGAGGRLERLFFRFRQRDTEIVLDRAWHAIPPNATSVDPSPSPYGGIVSRPGLCPSSSSCLFVCP